MAGKRANQWGRPVRPGAYSHAMETVVQFVMAGDVFMARGQRHIVRHAYRIVGKPGVEPYVLIIGERADGRYFEAKFPWGDTVDTVESAAPSA